MELPAVMKSLRQLTSELRKITSNSKIRETLQMQFILSQYRRNRVTDQQLCKAQEEMKFMADTYRCYLKSLRIHGEILSEYHGRGERTIEETANIVGFKLPHDPK